MNISENKEAQKELIREIVSLRDLYGISEFDFGVFLLAMGSGMMKNTGSKTWEICNMIRSAK